MLGLGVSLIKASLNRIPAWLREFKSRILSDGGITENTQCAKSDIRALQKLERTTIILSILEADLSTEGGTLEAKDCLIDSMEKLHTIL